MLKKSLLRICALTALASGVAVFFVSVMLFNPETTKATQSSALMGALTFAITFLVCFLFMRSYVFERLNVIFKIINTGSSKPFTITSTNSNDLLGDVEEQALDYAANRRKEIADLAEKETYRKEFLGDVSHELKTPIFNAQGYIETLLEGAIEDKDISRSYLLKAAKNLDRLDDIVADLVMVSKHESLSEQLNKEKFDLVELIKEVCEEQEMVADKAGTELVLSENMPLSIQVFADYNSIKTVVNNLVNNAIKYGREDGEVKITSYDIEENVLLQIADNGEGIAKQHLPRLFERFYRVDRHRSRFGGGNGLGLAICKHIMEAHDQQIRVTSELGVGTKFSITLTKAN